MGTQTTTGRGHSGGKGMELREPGGPGGGWADRDCKLLQLGRWPRYLAFSKHVPLPSQVENCREKARTIGMGREKEKLSV